MEDKEIKEYKTHKYSKCDFIDKWGQCNCVDVFLYEKYKYMNTPREKCHSIKDCHYKQLQAKTQECETHKNHIKRIYEALGLEVKPNSVDNPDVIGAIKILQNQVHGLKNCKNCTIKNCAGHNKLGTRKHCIWWTNKSTTFGRDSEEFNIAKQALSEM